MAETDFDDCVAHCEYPEFGSRMWFDQLWGRAFCAACKAGWTFRQAIRLAEGQHLCVFPRDLPGMPINERDWWRLVNDVPGSRLRGPDPDPLGGCEFFAVAPAVKELLIHEPAADEPDSAEIPF